MDKNVFKDLLFEMMNQHGEEELKMRDVDLYDKEDKIEIVVSDGSRFEIDIRKVS